MFDPNVFIINLWPSIRITLWLHLNQANEIAVRDHDPSQGCGLIMNRSFLQLPTVKEKDKKKKKRKTMYL